MGTHEEQSAIIPIGKALPVDGNWQKKSSANGLKIDFGVDENGGKAYFEISSERPYALIIGDVRVGKSSLLHTIIFQLLSNYSPEEVRIAVGDFKDGADFNVYAKGNLQSVDTVVNDEDPDAMLSCLTALGETGIISHASIRIFMNNVWIPCMILALRMFNFRKIERSKPAHI